MTFEKALIHLKSGKDIRLPEWQETYLSFFKNEIFWYNKRGQYIDGKLKALFKNGLTSEMLLSDNWEVVEE